MNFISNDKRQKLTLSKKGIQPKLLLSLLFLSSSTLLNAQSEECLVIETTTTANPVIGECGDHQNYLVDANNLLEYPTHFIRLNFHYISSSTEQNFTSQPVGNIPITAEDMTEIIIKGLNSSAENLVADFADAGSPTDDPILDFRFVSTGTYVWSNDSYIDTLSTSALKNQFGANTDKVINIFMNAPNADSGGRTNSLNSVIMWGVVNKYFEAAGNAHWYWTPNLLHEIIHCFGVKHIYYPNWKTSTNGCVSSHLNFDDGVFDTPTRQQIMDYRTSISSSCDEPCLWNDPCATNNLMHANANKSGLSPGQVAMARMHAATNNLSKLHDGTIPIDYWQVGQGYYSNDMNRCKNTDPNIVITTGQDKIWSDSKVLYGGITVKSGAKLTVNCKLILPADAKITVEKGAELVIDAGTITTTCDEPWWGIEVFGNDQLSQIPSSNQGKVVLKNGSRIENAKEGVTLIGHNPDGSIQWGSAGGILQAEDTYFYNCRRGVEFMTYQNYIPSSGTELNNKSFIKNCDFDIDDNYNSLHGNNAPIRGVTMWDIDKLRIEGCRFNNNMSADNGDANSYRDGVAITVWDASLRMRGLLDSQTSTYTRNEVNGFQVGVWVRDWDEYSPTTIDRVDFNDNAIGAEMKYSIGSQVTRNQFIVPVLPYTSNENVMMQSVGLSMYDMQDFEIEENIFKGTDIGNHTDLGVLIEDSWDEDNQIYRNELDNLGFGVSMDGDNGYTGNDPSLFTGLEVKCNDLGVTVNNYQDLYLSGSMDRRQGTDGANPSDPAGNRFSENPIAGPLGHFFIGGSGSFTLDKYYHHLTPDTEPYKSVQNFVNPFETQHPFDDDRTIPCPPNISTGDVLVIDLTVKALTLKSEILVLRNEYSTLTNNYNAILNGGIRPEIMDALLDPMESSLDVRDLLIQGSPYLDDQVLIEAINRQPVLNQWHLTEALVWNAPLSQGVLQEVINANVLTPYLLSL